MVLLVLLGAIGLFGATQVEGHQQPQPFKYIYRDATQPVNARVADLLSRMNTDEKVCPLSIRHKSILSPPVP
eukprot:COSAG02_NODE_6036_length_3855_cov_6.170128_1_plen_72_part_00